jgi:hypothetical protein
MALVPRLEVLLYVAAAASGAAFALALALVPSTRCRPVPFRVGGLVLVTGIGFGCRGVDAWAALPWAHHLQYVGFGMFPIAALLFAEAAAGWSAPLWLKLVVLAGTVWFGASWPTRLVDVRSWRLGMMGLQLLVVVAVAIRFARARAESPPGPRRSTLSVMTALAAGAVAGVVSENRELLGVALPRTGALGSLLVAYAAACSFHAGGLWRLRPMVGRLVGVALAAAALACALAAIQRGVPAATLAWIVVLPPVAFLAVEPARLLLCRDPNRRAGALLARLARMRPGTASAMLSDLRTWPEFRSLEVVELADLRALGYDQLGGYLAAHPRPVDRPLLAAALASADGARARPLEELLDLLERRDADLIASLGPSRILLLAIDGFIDPGAVRLALDPIVDRIRIGLLGSGLVEKAA